MVHPSILTHAACSACRVRFHGADGCFLLAVTQNVCARRTWASAHRPSKAENKKTALHARLKPLVGSSQGHGRAPVGQLVVKNVLLEMGEDAPNIAPAEVEVEVQELHGRHAAHVDQIEQVNDATLQCPPLESHSRPRDSSRHV